MNRIEEAMKKESDRLEAEADAAMAAAQKSPRTGIYLLVGVLIVVALLAWALIG